MSPYAYANDNPLRLTDPTGLQAVARVLYVASVEWLKDIGGGGGGAGAAPLIVLGGVISYATQHPEKTVPFMVNIMNDISQAMVNPIGFATNTVGGMIVASQNNDWKKQIEGHARNIQEHLDKLSGLDPARYGDPNDPQNRKDWKGDMKRAIENVKKRLNKLRKPFEQVLREQGWSAEKIQKLINKMKDEGFDPPQPGK